MAHTQVVYITGAASGVGLELAKRYASKGFSLALFDMSKSQAGLDSVNHRLVSSDQRVEFYSVDVTDADGMSDLILKASTEVGLPSIAINCAGIVLAKPFEQTSKEEYEKVVQVNLFGSRNFAHSVIPLLKLSQLSASKFSASTKQENIPAQARLVLIASMAGIAGNFGYSAYCSSKFAVVGLAEALRIELLADNVLVQVVCPTEIDTPMVRNERESIHPITLKLKVIAGWLTVEEAVSGIIKGIEGHSFFIVPGKMAKATYWVKRLVPNFLSQKLVDFVVRKELRKL
jgi:NAD(P)-dependent dehydrogenase (short-subunit alcohol dehydrogenase family)